MEMRGDTKAFGAVCPNLMGQQGRRTAASKQARNISLYNSSESVVVSGVADGSFLNLQDKVLGPRSSSPVTVYVELPCILKQGSSWFRLMCARIMNKQTGRHLGVLVMQSHLPSSLFNNRMG